MPGRKVTKKTEIGCSVMNSLKLWQLDSVLLSSNSSGQLHVSDHDGDSLSVDGAQVGVLEQTNQVCLCCFLESQNSL